MAVSETNEERLCRASLASTRPSFGKDLVFSKRPGLFRGLVEKTKSFQVAMAAGRSQKPPEREMKARLGPNSSRIETISGYFEIFGNIRIFRTPVP